MLINNKLENCIQQRLFTDYLNIEKYNKYGPV